MQSTTSTTAIRKTSKTYITNLSDIANVTETFSSIGTESFETRKESLCLLCPSLNSGFWFLFDQLTRVAGGAGETGGK